MVILYVFSSVIMVSLASLIAAIPFLLHKKVQKSQLLFMLSMSVGVLLANVFLEFIPEIYEHGHGMESGLIIMGGFMFFFIIEKLIHWHHGHHHEHNDIGHSHGYSIAIINIIGDSIHNFIDGLVIAGTYMVDIGLGIATTISVFFHEAPQELADFGVLLYSGLSKKKAILLNVVSGATAILGAVIGLLLSSLEGFTELLIPFAAGIFLYIAASNLVPQLHRHCKLKETFTHLIAILLGITIMIMIIAFGPGHGH